jgi:alanyl-tRNA synthetase
VQIALDTTPFYAESGGQVGDTGTISGPNCTVEVQDTLRPVTGVTVHYGVVTEGTIAVGDAVTATVDGLRRADTQRNHTATHMLQRVLRDVVGEHAAQAGSLVSPERLRFDFTHPRAVETDQLREIERRLNRWVRADGAVSWQVTDYQSALDKGAIALFGEKYGDKVRVVTIERGEQAVGGRRQEAGGRRQEAGSTDSGSAIDDGSAAPLPPDFATRDSIELCGGTHISRTGEIGYLRIVSESSVGSGLRRIEALTGRGAEEWVEQQTTQLRELAAKLNTAPHTLLERLETVLAEDRQRQQELQALRSKLTRGSLESVLTQAVTDNGLTLLATRVEADDAAAMREMGDWLRDKLGSGVIVLGSVIAEKPQFLAMVTPDMVKQGYHAGNLVKALAAIVGGGGGGRPEMAQAGGKDANQLDTALARVGEIVRDQKRA